MINIIFIGAPGSGKGTQSVFIERDYSIAHISTGDMLRSNIQNATELGKVAKTYVDKGELVPDSLVVEMLLLRLKDEDTKNGFMLDGYPRTIEQAKELDKILKSMNYDITAVINLRTSEKIILERLLNRGRADDNEEIIKNRLKVFKEQSEPVLEYYNGKVNVIKVESIGSPEEVYFNIKKELDKIIK